MKNKRRIYLSPPHMSEEGYEIDFIKDAYDSNWIAPLGPHVDKFEHEFAEMNGSKHALATSAGTAALHLTLRVMGIGDGDTVFCSSMTFCASTNPIVYERAIPVLIDSNRETWNMDPALLSDELRRCAHNGNLPKAVICVDLYGQSADYDPIVAACKEYNIPLINDSAEALGATYKGKHTGNFGIAGIFSFNGNKIITTSGGGMLVSENPELISKARYLSTQARDEAPHYQHSQIGFNYRMSNILAALGRGQLRVLEQRIQKKHQIFNYYKESLGGIPGIDFMPEPDNYRSTRWLTCITVDPELFGATCEDIRLKLEEENIESRPLWKPMHMQPVFRDCRVVGGAVSEHLFRQGLCLPSGTALGDDDLAFICEKIKSLQKS